MTTTVFALVAVSGAAQQKMPQTTTERIAGQSTVTTKQLKGTVVNVEGNNLLVRMSSGELRTFNVPESRRFNIDGNEVTVHDLKPGTRLAATTITTMTPVTERTTTVGTGKVWYVAGHTVILTLPNNENRMYKVQDSYRFNIGGQKATVFQLRKGMIVSAEKIVEEPTTVIASESVVTGHAPPPPSVVAPRRQEVAQAAPAPSPEPSAVEPEPQKPVEQAAAQPPPTELPKTGSPLPLVFVLGLLCVGTAVFLRRFRKGLS